MIRSPAKQLVVRMVATPWHQNPV